MLRANVESMEKLTGKLKMLKEQNPELLQRIFKEVNDVSLAILEIIAVKLGEGSEKLTSEEAKGIQSKWEEINRLLNSAGMQQ